MFRARSDNYVLTGRPVKSSAFATWHNLSHSGTAISSAPQSKPPICKRVGAAFGPPPGSLVDSQARTRPERGHVFDQGALDVEVLELREAAKRRHIADPGPFDVQARQLGQLGERTEVAHLGVVELELRKVDQSRQGMKVA